jgi:hypothetical protein
MLRPFIEWLINGVWKRVDAKESDHESSVELFRGWGESISQCDSPNGGTWRLWTPNESGDYKASQ